MLTFGEIAQSAFSPHAATFTGTWQHLAHPGDAAAPVDWSDGLLALAANEAIVLDETAPMTPYGLADWPDTRVQIPREDLPWGMPLWFGTSGDLSQQPDKSWIFWNAPKWVKKEPIEG